MGSCVSLFSCMFLGRMSGCHVSRILPPWPGTKPTPLAVKVQSPNHWTGREFFVFLLLFLKTLSLPLPFENLIIMCLSVDLFEFILLGSHWVSWMCIFVSWYQIWKAFSHYYFRYPLCPFSVSWPSGTQLFFYPFFFFLVLQIWNFPLPYLQVHWLFGCLNRYLNPSSEIFISVILIFSSRIYFKLSLGFPFFHISVLFMHCLLYFLHIFPIFFFLSIFKTVVL